jgi:hypothetical protein
VEPVYQPPTPKGFTTSAICRVRCTCGFETPSFWGQAQGEEIASRHLIGHELRDDPGIDLEPILRRAIRPDYNSTVGDHAAAMRQVTRG